MRDEELRNRYRRNYSTEPIITAKPKPAAPVAAAPTQTTAVPPLAPVSHSTIRHQSARPKRGKRRLLIVFFILVLIAAGAGAYLYQKSLVVVPANIVAQSDIPILYPSKLPAGYKINKTSFKVSNGNIISYYATNKTSSRLVFTVQARPPNFDYEKFYSSSMTDVTKIATPLGEGAVGTAGGRLLGSLATTKSWILITTSDKSGGSDKIQIALSSLKTTD